MGAFKLKSTLPNETQAEINRIQALPSHLRNTEEAAFLTALAPYLVNEVIERDSAGLITKAAGQDVPTGDSGFKKGALFIDTNISGNGLYLNSGDETSAVWSLVSEPDTNTIEDGTPVNAVAATGVLTLAGNAVNNETLTIGDKVYTFQSSIGAAVAAAGTLTLTGNAANTQTVVIGNKTYTFKTALTEVKATGTLTASGNFNDGEKVVIGGRTYTFTVNLSDPAVANEVKIGANASDSLDNLIAAINGAAGAGTTYATGTVAHADVVAAAGAGDTMVVTAKTVGVAGNAIATTETCTSVAFGAATLGSGVDAVANEVVVGLAATNSIDNLIAAINGAAGAGTTYSSNTVASTQVTAAAGAGDTMVVTAAATGDAGNSIATTETLADGAFGAATLVGGEGDQAANDVLIGANASDTIDNLIAAINGAAGAGTTYGTGTVAHTLVTAAQGAGDTMGLTAKVKGVAGNAIATTETMTQGSFGAATMTGGVDGTVGAKGKLYADASFLYVAKAANTVADQNWRRISLGSAY